MIELWFINNLVCSVRSPYSLWDVGNICLRSMKLLFYILFGVPENLQMMDLVTKETVCVGGKVKH